MKRFFKLLAVNIIVLIVFLLGFELALRCFWKMSLLKGEIYRTSPDRALRYELKPNLKTRYENYEVITNSAGFRGREYHVQKEKGSYRIVVIGDSVAFGKFVSEATLASRLELALNNFCPKKKFEVLNMGVEGYNSVQELEMLKVKGLKYNPDLVIVYYCFNDPDYPEYYFKKNFINRHSLLARYVYYRFKKYLVKRDRLRRGVKSIEENFQYLYSTESWQRTKEVILEMGDLTASRGIKMLLLIAPEMSEPVKDFKDGYPFWYINDKLDGIKRPNITVIDPLREFSRRNLKKDEVAAWSYPNVAANDIISEYIIRESQAQNINFCN